VFKNIGVPLSAPCGSWQPRHTVPSILAAEPAVLTGALIGYARVGTRDQNLDRQTDALTEAGCMRIFADKKSGKSANRPELEKALDFMRPGDTLVVASLDRLSRSLQDLISMVAELRELLGLLEVDPTSRRSQFDELKRAARRPSLSRLKEHTQMLIRLDQIGDTGRWPGDLAPVKATHFAGEARVLDASDMGKVSEAKRLALLVCLVHQKRIRGRDELAEMVCRRMATIHKHGPDDLADIRDRQRTETERLSSVSWRGCFLQPVIQPSPSAQLAKATRTQIKRHQSTLTTRLSSELARSCWSRLPQAAASQSSPGNMLRSRLITPATTCRCWPDASGPIAKHSSMSPTCSTSNRPALTDQFLKPSGLSRLTDITPANTSRAGRWTQRFVRRTGPRQSAFGSGQVSSPGSISRHAYSPTSQPSYAAATSRLTAQTPKQTSSISYSHQPRSNRSSPSTAPKLDCPTRLKDSNSNRNPARRNRRHG